MVTVNVDAGAVVQTNVGGVAAIELMSDSMISNGGNVESMAIGTNAIFLSGNGNMVTNTSMITASGGGNSNGVRVAPEGANNTIVNEIGGMIGGGSRAILGGANAEIVVNKGTLTGGTSAAIALQGGADVVEIWDTSVITGDVNAGAQTDILRLNGDGGMLDAGDIGTQYISFETFQKIGTGTWTLTGNGGGEDWDVVAGTLRVDATSLQGNSVNDGTLVFDQGADATYTGIISGTGGLAKEGAGNLTLTGAHTYSGGTTVTAGTLTGSTASLQGGIANNATVVFDQAADGTFAGNMTGGGSLTKLLGGNLTLTGTNSYSGGTTVSAGMLTGHTASLQGAIDNDAAVTFNQVADGTYGGLMSGTGGLTKVGAGNLTLTAANTFAGGTTLTAGGLIINGSLASDVNAAAGTTVGGSGAINAALITAGRVAPGNSIGTMTVTDVTFNAGSVLEVEVDAAGNSDLLMVNDTATINASRSNIPISTRTITPRLAPAA